VDVVATIPAAPTVAPPAPDLAVHPAANVRSLFSDSYTPAITGINFSTPWSNSPDGVVQCPGSGPYPWPNCGNLTVLNLGGNNVMRYVGVKYVGVAFGGQQGPVFAQLLDASTMTHLHVDVWTPDASKFGIQLVDFPDATASNVGNGVSRTVSLNGRATYGGRVLPITQGSWIGLDIPLDLFVDLPRSKLGLMLWLDNGAVAGGGVEGGTFFIDNVYFWKN